MFSFCVACVILQKGGQDPESPTSAGGRGRGPLGLGGGVLVGGCQGDSGVPGESGIPGSDSGSLGDSRSAG